MVFKEIDKDTMKRLHETELDILKEFIRVCEKNKLTYFAVGGTLIGTVKYKGFIPWDDDVDIGMPRKDYDKFIEIASKELKDDYYLQSGNDYKNGWNAFTKVRKKNTLANEEALMHLKYPKGIFIDIFPYDNVPTNDSFSFKLRSNYVRILIEAVLYKWKVKNIKQVRHPFLVFICGLMSKKYLKKRCLHLMEKYNKKETKYMTSYCGAYTMLKETHLKETLLPTKSLNFEGIKIAVPNEYDKFLRHIYGNYENDPPKEKQVNHAMMQISFDCKKDGLSE